MTYFVTETINRSSAVILCKCFKGGKRKERADNFTQFVQAIFTELVCQHCISYACEEMIFHGDSR